MNLRKAEENGCPDKILLKCELAGIKSIGTQRIWNGKWWSGYDWKLIEYDIDYIISEQKQKQILNSNCPGQLYFDFFNES